MQANQAVGAVPLEDVGLDLDELARACGVEREWVERHVQAGVLGDESAVEMTGVRFHSGDLVRALRLLRVEREFDADEYLAGLVVDMGEEIRRLRSRLRVLGYE